MVNAETTAFIVADAWFVLIAAAGGLLTGIAGYVYVVRRRGAPAALGLILGGLAAAAIMWWITGEVMLGLVTLGAGYRLFTKDSPEQPDNIGMAQFIGLLIALSAVASAKENL